MRIRIRQITSLIILAASAALAGCAVQAQTTEQWAMSKGYQPVELQGKEYFCRAQPEAARSHPGRANCLTLGALRRFRLAEGPNANAGDWGTGMQSDPVNPVGPADPSTLGFWKGQP